jgi:hypothetical protein
MSSYPSTAVLAVALLLIAGCSEPDGPVLQGQWGGEHVEVVADRKGAEIRPGCGVARLRDPLVLDPAGHVDVRAVVDGVSFFQPIRFQATLDGDHLAVTLTWINAYSGNTTETYQLVRGKVPDFTGIHCPA